MLRLRPIASVLILLLFSSSLFAQKSERKDSLVRLLGCDRLQQIEEGEENFRKALGNVRFEHNSTLLLCDTALWNVGINTIKAIGHVRIIQNRTVLSSESLDYLIDENLARFRGEVVQLQDKDKNTLRTRFLDYNTKDSVATFTRGAAFRDKDGQIIESDDGNYDSKTGVFQFFGKVNMYTDSILVKSTMMEYDSRTSVAVFGKGTHAWKEEDMLSADSGWYDRRGEVFDFSRNVHLMTESQESWSDSLKYYRIPNNLEMSGNVELLDTTRKVAAVAGYMQYIDSLQYILMNRDPAVIAVTEEDGQRDTVYIGADTLAYRAVFKCDIPEYEFTKSKNRVEQVSIDAVEEYRKKAAEAARVAVENAKEQMEMESRKNSAAKRPAPWDDGPLFWDFPQLPDSLKQLPDSLKQLPDSLASPTDSLKAGADSLAVPDSTKIGFLKGIHNVKVFRKDMQVSCDSLEFNELDSLVRLYRSPLVWNEIRRQYSADSIAVVIRNRMLEKASLMSDAFIIVKEDSTCFDQIKGTEMMAYFDSTGALRRFDSMGGSSGLFYLEENGVFATVNKFSSKMLTATFRNGEINDLYYFEDVKSDAYPVVQLTGEERILKGFEWQPEKRPKGPEDVTEYKPRKTERDRFSREEKPPFYQTDIYFPGHIDQVFLELQRAANRKKAQQEQKRQAAAVEELVGPPDQEFALPDSVSARPDSIAPASPVAEPAVVADRTDTLVLEAAQIDSLLAGHTIEALKPAKPSREELREQRQAKREARWAALDARDAEKAAKKAAKDAEKQRVKMEKMLKAREKREAREQRILDRYKARYEKKKARKK